MPGGRRGPRDVVSPTSAERFAGRARAARVLELRPAVTVLSALTVLGLVAWVLVGSPWLLVDRIGVSGAERVDPAQVREVLADLEGQHVALVGTGTAADRVERITAVASARVVRDWPSGVRVMLIERVPVAAVEDGDALVLVDGDGAEVERTEDDEGLPVIDVDVSADDAAARIGAVLAALDALSPEVAEQVRGAGADDAATVTLRLAGDRTVVWGDGRDASTKAKVLDALLTTDAVQIDVSVPQAPVTR